jgi:hypothetical protein
MPYREPGQQTTTAERIARLEAELQCLQLSNTATMTPEQYRRSGERINEIRKLLDALRRAKE